MAFDQNNLIPLVYSCNILELIAELDQQAHLASRLRIVLEALAANESEEGDYWLGVSQEENIKVHIQ